MPVDLSVFGRQQSVIDSQQLQEAFNLKKAQTQQAIQGATADQQAKQISLAGQIVGNSATDQSSYDLARSFANAKGIDTSFLPDQYNPDVVQRLRFAGASPTSQLSALIATQGHQLKAGIATGDVGSYGYGNTPSPASLPITTSPIVSAAPKGNPQIQAGTPAGNQAMSDLFGPTAESPSQPVILTPPKNPGETEVAYNNRLKNDPNFQATMETNKAKATQVGKDIAETDKASASAQETFGRLNQNLDALKTLNNTVPGYGGILPVGVKAKASLIGGDATGYDALERFNQVNQQQVVNAIGELVKGGQIRGNQYIEKIINRGFAIDPEAPKETRDAEIETLRNELKNASIQAQNTNATYTGAPKQEYIPTLPKGDSNVVTTQEQFDALPAGSKYIEIIDGKPVPHRKP